MSFRNKSPVRTWHIPMTGRDPEEPHRAATPLELLAVAVGGLLLVFALWWSYFKHPAEIDRSLTLPQAIAWGYSHYVVFAAIAALGAGLQVAIDATHEDVEG